MSWKKEVIIDITTSIFNDNYYIYVDYFNSHDQYNETDDIETIADIFGIHRHIYMQTLIKEFNGFLSSTYDIYFSNEEDCQKAIDWLYSLIVVNKLKGNNK